MNWGITTGDSQCGTCSRSSDTCKTFPTAQFIRLRSALTRCVGVILNFTKGTLIVPPTIFLIELYGYRELRLCSSFQLCGSLRLCAKPVLELLNTGFAQSRKEPQRHKEDRGLNDFEEGLMCHDILLNRISTEKNALLTV